MSAVPKPGFWLVVRRECHWLFHDRVALLLCIFVGNTAFVALRICSFRTERVGKHSVVRQNYSALDEVLQFTYVSGPGVRLEQLKSPFFDIAYVFPRFPRKAINKVFDEQGISARRARKGGISRGNTFSR